ncbi:hypothetical protein KAR91_51680 [Candidatus Pacearchaeota archaeon]|nr:hypothetical protein [Candidatus Pacearchaeota archaeon]
METKIDHIVNADDIEQNFWGCNYIVYVSAQGISFKVNAQHEQDALDGVIDYCQENCPGLLFTREDEEQLRKESLEDYGDERYADDYISGGNEGLRFSTHNIHIETA